VTVGVDVLLEEVFIIVRGGIRSWGTGAQGSMKSSSVKLIFVSTLSGKGQCVIIDFIPSKNMIEVLKYEDI
jgi:hypothetical protein